jgi:pimeloyl-ACP methyl ester carboxylesterase
MATRLRDAAELVLDVTADVPFDERVRLAASVHLPDLAAAPPRAVLICWPGGSYSRVYWDMHIDEYPGYSFAQHMTAQGFVVLATDPLGVGASSKPADGDQVNLDTMSAAAASFVEQVRALLAEASPELGGTPLPDIPIIGVGHSLGACLTTARDDVYGFAPRAEPQLAASSRRARDRHRRRRCAGRSMAPPGIRRPPSTSCPTPPTATTSPPLELSSGTESASGAANRPEAARPCAQARSRGRSRPRRPALSSQDDP